MLFEEVVSLHRIRIRIIASKDVYEQIEKSITIQQKINIYRESRRQLVSYFEFM
jgi:hypothetical protein